MILNKCRLLTIQAKIKVTLLKDVKIQCDACKLITGLRSITSQKFEYGNPMTTQQILKL